MERVLVTSKKLKITQDKKSVTRKTSVSDFGLSFKSTVFQTRLGSQTDLSELVKNKL